VSREGFLQALAARQAKRAATNSNGDPNRFGRAKAAHLRCALYRLLREHWTAGELPTSGRFLFYEAEQRGLVSKERVGARRPDQDTIEALTWLREHDLVPWDWITDETRSVVAWHYANSVAEYLRQTVADARIDAWGERLPPLLLAESRSLAGVLHDLAAEYLVPVAATNGQAGGFLRTEVAPLLPRVVLYLGDHDVCGDLIERNTRTVLEREVGGPLDWTRIAITAEQAHQLAAEGQSPILKTDRRYRGGRTHEAWETEALGQGRVTDLVRTALDALLPEPLEHVRERERAERDTWAAFLDARPPE
jgi:hypothetical protein